MSRIGRIHDDYLDPDKHLWPEGTEEDDVSRCARCKRDLEPEHQNGNPCDDPKFNYLDRGFCSSMCEAFWLMDTMKEMGGFNDHEGLRADVCKAIEKQVRANPRD